MIATLSVDLGAIRSNARRLRDLVAPSAFAAVVKSNAYGHGLVEVARALEGIADRLCVYSVEEAVALRDAAIAAPILILGPIVAEHLEAAHAAGASIALWDRGTYAARVASVARRRRAPFRVHVKIDTGVTRLGLDAAQAASAIERYLTTPELVVEGVFSHLASAEELDSPYTRYQRDLFATALEPIQERLTQHGVTHHLAASAAAMLWPETRLDMVRVGIALYGLWPSPASRHAIEASTPLPLAPALRLSTELVTVREVAAGTSVGYGGTYRTPTAARIGVLPIGYAEAVPRGLSNRGAVLIDGVRCPIVGRVCMNMTLIDVTGAPGARPGSPVTMLGKDGELAISADEWALWTDSINYEIVARLPSEIPRTYAG